MSCVIKEESPSDTEEYQEITNVVTENITVKIEECTGNSLHKLLPSQNFVEIEVTKEPNIVQDERMYEYIVREHVKIKLEKDVDNSLSNVSSIQKPLEVNICKPTFVTSDQNVDLLSHVEDIKQEEDMTIEPVVLRKRYTVPIVYAEESLHNKGQTAVVRKRDNKSFSYKKGKKFFCKICNDVFTQRSDLKKHQIIHKEQKMYSCEQCNARFTQKSHIKRHLMTVHTGKMPFSCEQCDVMFRRKCDMVMHQKYHADVEMSTRRGRGEKIRKTAADYSREYRARKKAKIPKKIAKTPTERSREFRARRKALQKAANEHLIASCSANDAEQSIDNIQTLKRKPKTSTERSRECRARKKALQNTANEHLLYSSSAIIQTDVHQQSSPSSGNMNRNVGEQSVDNIRPSKEKAKTPTERSREFRARQRFWKMISNNNQLTFQ